MEQGIVEQGHDAAGIQKFDDKIFSSMVSGGFTPRLQLMTSNSDKCKTGEFPINHYALVDGQNLIDLGAEVDTLVIAWRPKALDMGEESIISVFNVEDPMFNEIKAKSEVPNSKCMFGPEFLVYLPTKKQFALFFMGSKSSRREAPNVRAQMGKAITLKSHKIETKSFTWYAPVCVVCSTPVDAPEDEDFANEVKKFNNPPATQVEKAEGDNSRAR